MLVMLNSCHQGVWCSGDVVDVVDVSDYCFLHQVYSAGRPSRSAVAATEKAESKLREKELRCSHIFLCAPSRGSRSREDHTRSGAEEIWSSVTHHNEKGICFMIRSSTKLQKKEIKVVINKLTTSSYRSPLRTI